MLDISGWKFITLLIVGIVVLGPERLPGYAAKLARLVRQVKVIVQNAQEQLKQEMGAEFDDVDWRQYDPRRYDPRRIVREALMGDATDPPETPQLGPVEVSAPIHDTAGPTPWDPEST